MSNDYFQFKQFTIWQSQCAMKVGTDGTLLGAWAELPATDNPSPTILDVGTGTGIIALMMAQRFPQARVVGIDIDGDAANQAKQNAQASPFANRVDILHGDFGTLEGKACYEAIVSNPPYFVNALRSPDATRTLARHAHTLPFRILMERSWQLLTDGGSLSVVVPADAQGIIKGEAALAGFFKQRECLVFTSPRKPAKRVLLAFGKHSAPVMRQRLTVGSEEYAALMADFYLYTDPTPAPPLDGRGDPCGLFGGSPSPPFRSAPWGRLLPEGRKKGRGSCLASVLRPSEGWGL